MKLAKEIFIIILIILAILLVAAIFLYDYIPVSKVVPTVEPYVLSTELEEEIDKEAEFVDSQVITKYEINSKDLKNYEKSSEYEKGKYNPFSMYTDSNLGSGGSKDTGNEDPTDGSGNSNTIISNEILSPK